MSSCARFPATSNSQQVKKLKSISITTIDKRPDIELKLNPDDTYMYSGEIFAQGEKQCFFVSDTIGRNLQDQLGLVKSYTVQKQDKDTEITIYLEHWYSRADMSGTPLIPIDAKFSGSLSFVKGSLIKQKLTFNQTSKAFVDPYSIFESERENTPELVARALEEQANKVYAMAMDDLLTKLERNWQ